jgi:hypothetical protein
MPGRNGLHRPAWSPGIDQMSEWIMTDNDQTEIIREREQAIDARVRQLENVNDRAWTREEAAEARDLRSQGRM